jgi:phosphatidate cytidylyltransferase
LILAAEWLPVAVWMKIWLAVILGGATVSALTGQRDRFGRLIASLAGCIVYLPVCLASVLWLWHADGGVFYVAFLYLVVATNDAFAQFTGQLFGNHSLAPRVSPAKTVEGAAGGILFAAMLGASLSLVIGWPIFYGALLGMVIGLAGLIGDLAESSWKRALGLKDFSTLLGAQGGVLDRFDSLILASPIFFLLLSP